MKLTPLTVDDVQTQWDWLRAGLLLVIAKTKAKYRPEDVYLRLRTDTAWAYAIDDPAGFVVFTREYDHDGLVLFIWIMWTPPNSIRWRNDEMYAELERIARECKAKRIRMQSPRTGWEDEPFFTRVAFVYEHELT